LITCNTSPSINVLITGTSGLTKTGNGGLDLGNTANNYTGVTTVSASSLTVRGAAGSVSALGAIPGNDVFINGTGWILLVGANTALNFGQKQFHISGDGGGVGGAIVNT